MPSSNRKIDNKRSLGNLGISIEQEDLYRWLLKKPGVSVQEVAQALSFGQQKAQRVLDSIEAIGLVTHTPERPRRYFPASPDIALEAMIIQRERELQDVRRVVGELQNDMEINRGEEEEQIVELITNYETERQALQQMHNSAQYEIAGLTRPPIRVNRLGLTREQDRGYEILAHQRGVHYRSIVDVSFFDMDGAINGVRSDMEDGEDVRVTKGLPLKMVMVDRRIALVPLNLERHDSPSLLVRTSTLVDALYSLFELLWEKSSPISFEAGKLITEKRDSEIDGNKQQLISLMAAGLNDKKISSEMSITTRTIQRRLNELMDDLGASTRFQAGWLSALRLVTAGQISEIPESREGKSK